jgi:hypothetical protein
VGGCVQGGSSSGVPCSLAQVGAAGFGPKSETEALGLGLGSALGNGSEGKWEEEEEEVSCGVCGGCGDLGGHSMAQVGGRCLGLTTRNRATGARFQVCHVEQRWRVVGHGSGGMWMEW